MLCLLFVDWIKYGIITRNAKHSVSAGPEGQHAERYDIMMRKSAQADCPTSRAANSEHGWHHGIITRKSAVGRLSVPPTPEGSGGGRYGIITRKSA